MPGRKADADRASICSARRADDPRRQPAGPIRAFRIVHYKLPRLLGAPITLPTVRLNPFSFSLP
jgi:hypothetical protein